MEIPFTVTINKTTIDVTDREVWRKAVARGDAFFAAIMGEELPPANSLHSAPIATVATQVRTKRVPPPRPEGPTKPEIAEKVLREVGHTLTTLDLADAMVAAGWKTDSIRGPKRNKTLENPLSANRDKFVKRDGKWGLREWENPLIDRESLNEAEEAYLKSLVHAPEGEQM